MTLNEKKDVKYDVKWVLFKASSTFFRVMNLLYELSFSSKDLIFCNAVLYFPYFKKIVIIMPLYIKYNLNYKLCEN